MNKLILALCFLVFSSGSWAITCIDYKNQPVAVMPNSNMGDAAAARSLPNGQGVIYYNPAKTQYFSKVMLDFVYAHECAHHALGHGALQPVNEQAADCWAIRTLASFGLNQNGLVQLQQQIAAMGGAGSWTHAPGIVRANNLLYCLQ